MNNQNKTFIYFFVSGERYASRTWAQVPRVGDEVMLRVPSEGKGKYPFTVDRVVWGVEGPEEDRYGIQAANVELSRKNASLEGSDQ